MTSRVPRWITSTRSSRSPPVPPVLHMSENPTAGDLVTRPLPPPPDKADEPTADPPASIPPEQPKTQEEATDGNGSAATEPLEEPPSIKENTYKDQIARLEMDIVKMVSGHLEDMEAQAQRTREVEDRLRRTKDLLDAKSAELAGANAFLSAIDRLSEKEVADIVHDLNENIYQAAVNLTEEWEKLRLSQTASQMDVDNPPQPQAPSIVQRVVNRDPSGLTFLLQSCLCSRAVEMTSRWSRNEEWKLLDSVYRKLSASEGQAVRARWRLLTYKYLSPPPPDIAHVVEGLGEILDETGLFTSTEQLVDLLRTAAPQIRTIIQLSQKLESAFMVEVTSSDMALHFETPGTAFENAHMVDEFGSDGPSAPGSCDKIAGTTGVGLKKTSTGRGGKGSRTKLLLRTKVVLERDIL